MKSTLLTLIALSLTNISISADLKSKGPIANDDVAIMQMNKGVELNFLQNDVNQSGLELGLTYILVNEPQHGKIVEIDELGNLVYVPNADFVGVDMIRYYVIDPLGVSSEMAKIEFSVSETGVALGVKADLKKLIASSVYPNPVVSVSVITLETSTQNNNSIHVYDITGKELKNEVFSGNKYMINGSDYTQGIYVYQVRNQENELISIGRISIVK